MTACVAHVLAYYCHCVNLSVNVRLAWLFLFLCCLFCRKSGKISYVMKSSSSSSDEVNASFNTDYSDAIRQTHTGKFIICIETNKNLFY